MTTTRTNVPLLDLKAQYAPIRAEIEAAVLACLESQQFILGPEVEALEREIAEYSECRYAVGVSSGTDAILAVLMALGIGAGDEVIVPTYTFFATAGCVARLGATPVFVDIEPRSFNLDVAAVERAITDRTRAIMPVHLFGQMAEMDAVMELARRRGIPVIEDAAQAVGSEYRGRRAGSIGIAACFSFFPSKNLGGIGDGGMVTTNDAAMAERLRLLRSHGAQPKYHHRIVGANFRLDAVQAAVLRVKLRYLDGWTEGRQRNAAIYRDLFKDNPQSVVLPEELPERRHIYNQFVVRTPNRDAVMASLKNAGIGTEVYYPIPLHLQECFAALGHSAGSFPVAEAAALETLALPIYPELTEEQIRTVVGAVAAAQPAPTGAGTWS